MARNRARNRHDPETTDRPVDGAQQKALLLFGGVSGFLAAAFVGTVTLAWASTGWDDASATVGASDAVSLLEGERVYMAQCAQCHGPNGEGGIGVRLADGVLIEKYPNIGDQIAVITNGRADMPGFENTLAPAQIEAVARFEREQLGR